MSLGLAGSTNQGADHVQTRMTLSSISQFAKVSQVCETASLRLLTDITKAFRVALVQALVISQFAYWIQSLSRVVQVPCCASV